MENVELKPCPFCGSLARMYVAPDEGGFRVVISCMGDNKIACFCESVHWALKREWAESTAIKAWNRRAEQ